MAEYIIACQYSIFPPSLLSLTLIGVGEEIAVSFLLRTEWKIELAVNEYFENPDMYPAPSHPPPVDKRKLETLFMRYRGIVIGGRRGWV